ncbi:unnamed protein product [Pseudo-nitzschia multistriata]|uniref:Uncharacterized protein n=1 Tax=Pseudo-nitzschia multistriata TaxID=183589 RepID=A0A448YWR9_9STRA|nr:unnamed protein product [Pseudo-nitzschia multistriata]
MPGDRKKKQSYRSIHTDYKPFLKYIRNHSDIDDTTVERLEKKYGGVASNGLGDLAGTNTNTNTKNTNTNTMDTRGTVGASFSSQAQAAAASRKERDDARHADLHANYQHGSYTDGDKIFLLKREIDTLRSKLKEADPKAKNTKKNRLSAPGGSALAPLSALLAVGLLLVVARTLRRRIARARAGGSLLEREEGPASVELGVAGVTANANANANAGQSTTGGWRPLVPLEDA